MRRRAILAALIALHGCRAAPAGRARPGPPTELAVSIRLPGADPMAIEGAVLGPLEEALATVDGATYLRGVARDGEAEVRLGFADPAAADAAKSAAWQALFRDPGRWPDAAEAPVLRTFAERPVLRAVLASETLSAADLRRLADELGRSLETAPGVERVTVCGGATWAETLTLDPARSGQLGLTVTEVVAALAAGGATGAIAIGPDGWRGADPRLLDLVLAERDGGRVRLGDVARVSVAGRPAACQATRSGRPVVVLDVAARDAGVTAAIVARLSVTAGRLPPQTTLSVAATGSDPALAIDDRGPRWSIGAWPPESAAGEPTASSERRIEVDRARAADLGVPLRDLAPTVALAIAGQELGLRSDGLPRRLELQLEPAALGSLQVRAIDGRLVALADLLTTVEGPPSQAILHEGRERLTPP